MGKLKTDKNNWFNKAQLGELLFHQKDSFRPSGGLDKQTKVMFDGFGFNENMYRDKVVIDAGSGSMLRTKYFIGAELVAIEPLASEFSKIGWSDLHLAKKVFDTPLEQLLPSLLDSADLVISINVLDHCYDFEICMDNLRRYLKAGGLCFISFDTHKNGVGLDDMHPLDLNEVECEKVFERAGFEVQNKTTQPPYGGGDQALNYWLRIKNV